MVTNSLIAGTCLKGMFYEKVQLTKKPLNSDNQKNFQSLADR